jgi:hypothetical protein
VLTETGKRWHQANVERKTGKPVFEEDLQLFSDMLACSAALRAIWLAVASGLQPCRGCIPQGCSIELTFPSCGWPCVFLNVFAFTVYCGHKAPCTGRLSAAAAPPPPPPHSSWGWLETAALCSQHDKTEHTFVKNRDVTAPILAPVGTCCRSSGRHSIVCTHGVLASAQQGASAAQVWVLWW